MPHAVVVIRGLAICVVLLVLAGCGGSPEPQTQSSAPSEPTTAAPAPEAPTAAPDCNIDYTLLSKDDLESLRTGLKFENDVIKTGVKIPLEENAELTYTQLVVVYDEDGTPMELAAGELKGGTLGPILAVDELARSTFDWGSAAENGSDVDLFRNRLAQSDLVTQVDQCGPPGS